MIFIHGSTDMYGRPFVMNNAYSAHQQSIRTVYIGNVPNDLSVSDIMDQVKTGAIQAVRPLPEKNGLFITFIEHSSAAQFYIEATRNRFLIIRGHELKIGWGKPNYLTSSIQAALQNGASRNVYLGLLDPQDTEESLRQELSRFGHIEHLKIITEKRIGFVHFLCITNAVKCVSTLQTESRWQAKRVNFGKDRCARNMYASTTFIGYPTAYEPYSIMYPPTHHDPVVSNRLGAIANRTIYLGNIHPDTTTEDICNAIRGGILSQLKFIPEKHIAFITFVDPILADNFFHTTEFLMIKNRRLKLGWGKPSALSFPVLNAVQNGGSRNVYIGNIDEFITEEKLKHDFSEYGDIELVNTLKEKNCAFVNFTSISGAVKAIEGIRTKEEYKKFRINYGKDRCGNTPRFNTSNDTNNNVSNVQT
ncbi:hypothetical protein BDF21DRAFT_414889 [Thamnidium elegans]|uniref:RRM domain-containing protein n=1 Tax=Thamnidium elegans TaxID=101142 RepID=A0A8H7SSM6_9FUNG|nr:hypothetical protein INT48_007340 [Thamnidium elegans]KAI8085309.1 hypothetical protein BDF21DRAFT_414889 [Thamnidium elegans]